MHGSQPGRGAGDPYLVLGVDMDASRQDISRAYRRAVHGAHPDTQPKDPLARRRFEALTEAYDLLNDPARRAEYDRAHAHAGTPRPTKATGAGAQRGTPVIVAGPVSSAPATASSSRDSHDQHFEDPPVFLGLRTQPSWGWRR